MPNITPATLKTRLLAAQATLENADASWSTLTPAQKDAAAQLKVKVCIALIFALTGQLDP